MRAPTSSPRTIRFKSFVADLSAGELHKNGAKLKLQEQPFKVLALLLVHAGEVVSRKELRKTLWPRRTYVDFDHGINMAIGKIREALGDSSEESQFVETLGRRGYRFIAAVELVLDEEPSPLPPTVRAAPTFSPAQRHSVGRKKELAELATAFELVARGRGVLVCVAGEPGIGKTTLVQDFLSSLQVSGKSFELAIGRCSQRLAGEEAYLPFLEAVASLLGSNSDLKAKLRELAPSWYAQLFKLSEKDPVDVLLQEHVRSTTQERVKRELAAFVCEITVQYSLVLFFDDVHWTDPSTVDLLAYLATKFDTTRILVIVTYRPSELLLLKHPFIGVKSELRGRDLCREINVEFLALGDIERYIGLEFLGNRFPREFAGVIHSRTEGNPLFMVDLLRYLRDRKIVVKTDGDAGWHLAQSLPDLSRNIPQSVSGVIDRKIDQLSERDREVLTVAAVQGYECDSAAIARALAAENMEIEEILDRLERVHAFVNRVSEEELFSGAPTVRYRFVHVLYQNALYASLTPTRRVALSAALAHALEALYGDRKSSIASQLAFLYETARDFGRASEYFLLAAQNAQAIFANQEAIALSRRGLALLTKLPDTPERTQKELDLQLTLAFSLLWTLGYASPETGANMARAKELCEALGDTASLFPVMWGLWHYYLCKADLKFARETAEQLLSSARDLKDPALILGGHISLGFTLEHQGEPVVSRQQFEESAKHYDFAQHSRYVQLYRFEPGIQSESEMVRTLWLLGFPDQARRKMDETLARAQTLAIPLSLAFAQRAAASLYQNLCLPEKARDIGEACISLCDAYGIMLEKAWVFRPYGWAIAQLGEVEEGIRISRTGLQTQLSIGARIGCTQALAVLGETLWRAGRRQEALEAVEEGLAISKQNGNAHFDAELWRLKGELLKVQDKTEGAESCFQKAIEIARHQSAKSLGLRACMSLARLRKQQGKRTEAQQVLGEIYAWFTEGFDTADLKEAASLLNELT